MRRPDEPFHRRTTVGSATDSFPKMSSLDSMGQTYIDRAMAAEALARNARKEAERQAFEEIARIWRRLASGERAAIGPDARSSSDNPRRSVDAERNRITGAP